MAEFKDCITSVVFFCGCDMNCQFCQNPDLITGKDCEVMDWQDVAQEVEWDVIDWLSLTGGEPLYSVSSGYQGDQLVSLLSYAREERVRVNLDTNGYYGDMRKESLLLKVAPLLDCVSVDIKYLDPYMIARTKQSLERAKIFNKCRFRMVAYKGMYYKNPYGMKKLAESGIRKIRLMDNSGHGRGKNLGKAGKEMIHKMIEYFDEYGIELHE